MPKPTFDQLDSQVLRPENAIVAAIMAAFRKYFSSGAPIAAGTAVIGSTKDAGPDWASVRKITPSADMTTAANVTDAPTSGQKIVVDDLLISTDTEMSVTFTEETSGTVIRGPIYLAASSTTQITLRGKTKLATADKKLKCQASAAGNLTVEVVSHSEA